MAERLARPPQNVELLSAEQAYAKLNQELLQYLALLRNEVQRPSVFSPKDLISEIFVRLSKAIDDLLPVLRPVNNPQVEAMSPAEQRQYELDRRAQLADQAAAQRAQQRELEASRAKLEQDQTDLLAARREFNRERGQVEEQLQQLQRNREEQIAQQQELERFRAADRLREEEAASKRAQVEGDEKTEMVINSEILLLSVAIPEINTIVAMAREEKPAGTERPPSHPDDLDSSPHRRRVATTVAAAAQTVSSTRAGVGGDSRSDRGRDSGLDMPDAVPVATAFSQPEAAAAGAYGCTTGSDSAVHVPAPHHDELKRDTISVSLAPLADSVGGLSHWQDPRRTLQQALESFSHNPTVSVVGRYKSGKSTLLKKLLGYPKGRCLHHPIHNTKGLNLYIGKTPGQPVFIDVEGFAQPLTTMDPYFLRELAMQFCASVSRCIILVVNHIDITDLLLIRNIRNIAAKGVIVVVHNLMTVTSKADMDEYKSEIARSMTLSSNQFNEFALSNQDNTELHYVIGDLIDDSDWNVKVGRRQETVFDVITRMHCNGESVQHDLECCLREAFSKVVSKYFDPVGTLLTAAAPSTAPSGPSHAARTGTQLEAPAPTSATPLCGAAAGYFSDQTWCDVSLCVPAIDKDEAHARSARKVLRVTYVDVMRRAFAMYNLQPHSSITYSWMRDDAGTTVYLVVNCPGFVLTGLKFLKDLSGGSDERTILLGGTQQIYGRMKLSVRELLRSPLPLIQNAEHVIRTLQGRIYDRNGSVILAFTPNANAADVIASASLSAGGVLVARPDWDALDHRILGPDQVDDARKQCSCVACINLNLPLESNPESPGVPGSNVHSKHVSKS